LEKKVTLVDVLIIESIKPLFMGFSDDSPVLPS